MTQTATPVVNYTVTPTPPKIVYSDDTFNCRGSISPLDVVDLAQSIQAKGLQFPILIQPRCDVTTWMPDGYEYRIVAGHRRFKAWQVSGMPGGIPAFIRTGLSEIEARVLNLSENFDRKDLNLLQEAKALEALWKAGLPRDSVARELKKSSGWVQVRYNLLALPEEIQQEAAAGILNQFQIKQLYSLDTHEEMFEAVKKIKNAKLAGEKVDSVAKKKKVPTANKKVRLRPEMFEMMQLIAGVIGYGLHTRTLAWATGEITTAELFADLKEEADAQGKFFVVPLEF